jgi:tetratricopeptide (TPR) repeat protein
MRFKSLLPVILLVLAIATGCSDSEKKAKEQSALRWNQARASVLFGLASDQYKTGNFDPARKTVNEALRIDPDSARLRILSAKLAIEKGSLELAEKELERARQIDPKNPEADYLAGVVYQRWQRPDQAYSFYSSACDKNPNELAYLLAKSEMLVVMDRREEALHLLQDRVVYFEHSAVIRDAVGQLLVQFKRYKEAATILQEASILANDDPGIREHLGLAEYFAGQYRDATVTLSGLLSKDAYAKRADLWLACGRSQLEIAKLRDARQSLETAVQLDGSNASAWLALGRCAMELKDYRRADLSLRRAQAMDPDNGQARLMMGYLQLRQHKLNEALSSFQRASKLEASDTTSLCMVGYTLQKLGRQEEAARYYARALKISPGDDMAKKLMASVEE